jgi:hypothetical protein
MKSTYLTFSAWKKAAEAAGYFVMDDRAIDDNGGCSGIWDRATKTGWIVA